MKKKITLLAAGILAATLLTGCGNDAEITAFTKAIDDFCTGISEIDTSINNIDATAENAPYELLGYLDALDIAFQDFAELDFPEDFEYMESLADEAGEYMTEAVNSYKDAYSDGYNSTMGEYAKENYSRAYKRIQIIITLLHGEEPENINLTTESEE
uniref:hypothetical protein n=1 Tax=Acetatifactor sp. TaxID=1872090 RepID=UPI004055F591